MLSIKYFRSPTDVYTRIMVGAQRDAVGLSDPGNGIILLGHLYTCKALHKVRHGKVRRVAQRVPLGKAPAERDCSPFLPPPFSCRAGCGCTALGARTAIDSKATSPYRCYPRTVVLEVRCSGARSPAAQRSVPGRADLSVKGYVGGITANLMTSHPCNFRYLDVVHLTSLWPQVGAVCGRRQAS